jgi:nickel/cobalt transporter (NicO) family protein
VKHRLGGALTLAVLLIVAFPALVLAHPLGNFTINHYAGIRVSATEVRLDVVIDQAEIPTFQARQDLDTNGDGDVSAAEADAGRVTECRTLMPSLALAVAGAALPLDLTAAGLDFPTGAGGLPTMRLICELRAGLAAPLATGAHVSFTDRSFAERIGWREITVVGDGVTVAPSSVPATSVSNRLRTYPANLLQQPLGTRSVSFSVDPGGPAAPVVDVPDAQPLVADTGDPAAATRAASTVATPVSASVPGGIGTEIDALLRARDVTPVVLLASLLAAVALGAGHAITPGHGKTLMGAYLVGARGTPVHAIGLGLSVAVSHTIGILGLALVVVAAGAALPPDQFERIAPVVSALTLTAVGGWLLLGQIRRWRRGQTAHAHEHADDHTHETAGTRDHEHAHADAHEHSHGGVTHSHLPAPTAALSWRSLFVLGLAGGLVPSTNALLILLATVATNRPLFGLVLVVAFGLGMAAVMAGVGLALIYARDWIEARPRLPALSRAAAFAPALAAVFVLALGVVLTTQALGVAVL